VYLSIFELIVIKDTDEKSLQFARQNVQINKLQQRIKLLQAKADGPLLPLDQMGLERYYVQLLTYSPR